jgi:hypothetical protein
MSDKYTNDDHTNDDHTNDDHTNDDYTNDDYTGNEWIHQVRRENYEKTKNMSVKEIQAYFREGAEKVAKEFGLTIAKASDFKNIRTFQKK